MTSMIKKLFIALISFAAMGWGVARADLITLNSWNVDEINASGDYVQVITGTVDGRTTLTIQWIEGSISDDLWTAIGLDKFFYNSSVGVHGIYVNSVSVANDVTSLWTTDYRAAGYNAGGGFGSFLTRNTESAGQYAINDTLIFVLNGTVASWTTNSNDFLFAAHVRYGQDCSGWVGGPGGEGHESASSSDCVPVPEPATLALFGLGLLGFGLSRRRRA